jgi:hypothetical protein
MEQNGGGGVLYGREELHGWRMLRYSAWKGCKSLSVYKIRVGKG